MTYERITISGLGSRNRTVWALNIQARRILDTDSLIIPVCSLDGGRTAEVIIADQTAVVRRIPATMNNRYAELEVAS